MNRPSPIREFAGGFATLGRGFAFWRERPGIMWLGLLPAGIVAAVVVTVPVALVLLIDPITLALTAFAEDWEAGWRSLLRVVLGVALVIATVFLAVRAFTAVTLFVGAPFYDRIQAAADESRGAVGADAPGFWGSLGATIVLVLQSFLASVVVLLVGLIPVAGAPLAAVLGFVLTAWGISRELTFAPLARRGLDGRARSRLRHARRARTFGFGVAVQLCFLVPGAAVLVMPAAVAGSAFLARDLLSGPPTAEAQASGPSAAASSAPSSSASSSSARSGGGSPRLDARGQRNLPHSD